MSNEKQLYLSWTYGVVVFLIVAVIFYVARTIFIPLALAILVSFILSPLVSGLERLRLGRVFSVIFVSLIGTVAIAMLGWMMTKQILNFATQLPDYKHNLVNKVQQFQWNQSPAISRASETINEIKDAVTEPKSEDSESTNSKSKAVADNREETSNDSPPRTWSDRWLPGFLPDQFNPNQVTPPQPVRVVSTPQTPYQYLSRWLGPLIEPIAMASMMYLLTIFILFEREEFRGRLVQLLASSNVAIATLAISEISSGISRWLRTMFFVNALYGTAVAIALYFIGVPNPMVWGVWAFGCRFVPYVGPWMAAAFPLLISLAVFDGWVQPLVLAGVFIVYELIVNMVLEPLLYGKSIGISPLGVVIAMLFWAWLWGPAGLILAIPITFCLVVLGRHIPQLQFFTVLLGELSSMPTYHSLYQRLLAFQEDEATAILNKQLENNGLSHTFENVLVPLLQRNYSDHQMQAISKEQFEYVLDFTEDAVETAPVDSQETEARGVKAANAADVPHSPANERRILVVPISNRGDEISAKVVARIASRQPQIELVIVSTALLANEIVQQVEEQDVDAVFLTGLAPYTSSKVRLVENRLKKSNESIPLVYGFWRAAQETHRTNKETKARPLVFNRVEDAIKAMGEVHGQRRVESSSSELPDDDPVPTETFEHSV